MRRLKQQGDRSAMRSVQIHSAIGEIVCEISYVGGQTWWQWRFILHARNKFAGNLKIHAKQVIRNEDSHTCAMRMLFWRTLEADNHHYGGRQGNFALTLRRIAPTISSREGPAAQRSHTRTEFPSIL